MAVSAPDHLPERRALTAPARHALDRATVLGRRAAQGMPRSPWLRFPVTPDIWRLAVGAVAVLVPGLLLAMVHPALPVTVPGVMLMVAIAFSTYLADWAGGATALALAALVLDARFIGNRSSFSWPHGPTETIGFGITLVCGGALVWLIEWIKREGTEARVNAAAARAAANALSALDAPSTHAPGAGEDVERVLGTILTAMIRVSRAHAGALLLATGDGTELVRAVTYGLGQPDGAPPETSRVGEGFAGRVALERRPLTVGDIAHDPAIADAPLVSAGVHGVLGVPLIGPGDRLLGVAHIGLLVPHRFSPTDVARLEALAQRAVGWLEAVRVTDQRELLLKRAREERQRLRMIISAMPEAVVVAESPDGRIVAVNDAAVRLLGPLAEDGAATDAVNRLRRPDGEPAAPRDLPLARALATGEIVTGVELVVRDPAGGDIPVLASAAPLREYAHEADVAAVVGVFQDIRRLKEADRLKDEFVSVVSHELRSPLTPIRGFVQLVARELEKEGSHPTHVAWLHSIEGQVDRMTRLVDDLLDVSRLRAGRLDIRPQPTDLVVLCQEVLRTARSTAPDHEIAFRCSLPSLVGSWDPDRLHQVIDNLVGNALKYGPPRGRVTVSLTAEPGTNRARLEVADQGPGIPPEDRPQIFSAFYRTADATTSRVAGLGLGLFICHELVVAHGGTIAVGEASGGGAAFTVTLPCAAEMPESGPVSISA